MVDRGLKPTIHGKLLLLMGVHEEVAAYRRAAKHANLLTADCPGGIDFLSLPDIAARAAQACREHYRLIAERVLDEYREMSDRRRTLADALAVVRAAAEGRVHRLCIQAGAELNAADGEDLINAAAVDTIRTGGEVFMLPQDKMPAPLSLAAILRY
jgi:hypothetical protein